MTEKAHMSWYIEREDGSRSRAFDTLEQAKNALPDERSHQARMSPRFSEPVRFVSTEGQIIQIPPDDAG
jgi:hypothetical protein